MGSEQEYDFLLLSISKGDQQAFQKLFMLQKDRLYSIALAYTENRIDAEETVQEAFMRIWKYRHNLTEIKNFPAWMNTVTKNCALTALKKRVIENKEKEGLSYYFNTKVNDSEHLVEEKELQIILEKALTHLSPQQRKVFELSRIYGKDRKTIAENLGLSSATVSVHLTIALRIVRSFFYTNNYNAFIGFLLLLYISL